ncbi:MAG: hypothetical protein HQK76_13480 [Desulfobacterales bacterium]|nr:hypothetical protein [Desulfobacterales bacterium]
MIHQRIQYGRCSFIPPVGFVIEKEASPLNFHATGCCINCSDSIKKPVIITLTLAEDRKGLPTFLPFIQEMDPDAYPTSITLTTNIILDTSCPLEYLNNNINVMQRYIKNFKIYFCEKWDIGDYPAARAQCSFITNFNIFQLSFSWVIEKDILVSTMMVAESKVDKAWKELENLALSVKLSA